MSCLVATIENIEVIEITCDSAILESTLDNTEVFLTYGEQGIPGVNGVSGNTASLVAGANLGGNRAIIDAATYADNTNVTHANRVIGITQGAASIGANVTVQVSGELSGFSGLSLGPVYLSTNGTLTQTIPTTGILQQLGIAINPTTIIIYILPALKLT